MVVFAMFLTSASFAQDDKTVSDEELQKYAVAMDSIETLKQNLISVITDLVENNPKVTAGRYNELSKIINDSTKLVETSATDEEVNAIKEIVARKKEETDKINEVFQSLAKDYIGASTYNKVRSALKSDAELKTKYDALLAKLKQDDTE
jgi:uncharacterized protein YpuA (DUF1002 family)